MNDQQAIQNLLHRKLAEAQKLNPRYSLRAFSKRIGIESGPLSAILNGRRRVSRKFAQKLADKLMLDPQERSTLLSLFPEKQKYRKDPEGVRPSPDYLQISAAQHRVMSEWQHMAILSLINTTGFKAEPAWIAERLGISDTTARDSVDRLLQLGLLKRAGSRLERSYPRVRTPDDIANVSLRKAHEQTLELAKESLYREDVSERDHTTLTLAFDIANLQRAKELIRKFQDDFDQEVGLGERTQVYRLAMQFFPLTLLKKRKV